MEQLTIYTVKSKKNGYIWLFKYHLNGDFKSFEILDGSLSPKQITWLFSGSNFPSSENVMQNVWMSKKLKDNFEITKAAPVLDFENLWNLYGHKISKFDSEKQFKKLKDADKIKCFLAIPGYKKYLSKTGTAIAHLSTFINRQYYNDDWTKA
ncbi:hypothetical protein [Flavobacterium fluviatile]|uniref:hypothetical protein n=1 Tax=Flavobacterium fluviatile TaxID=1862387 RepID=UPI0013D67C70|nr:hypothetical protein [Flavobacterium fluviatile]